MQLIHKIVRHLLDFIIILTFCQCQATLRTTPEEERFALTNIPSWASSQKFSVVNSLSHGDDCTKKNQIASLFSTNRIEDRRIASVSTKSAAINETVCSTASNTANQCVSSAQNASGCNTCINTFFHGLPIMLNCSSYQDLICSGIASCGCTECREEFELVYSCKGAPKGCDPIDCPVSEEEKCEPAIDAFRQCFSEMDMYSGPSCADCILKVLNELRELPDGPTYPFYKETMCSSLATCGCIPCQNELEEVFGCLIDSGPLDCCDLAFDFASECVSNTSSGLSCDECINTIFQGLPSNTSCTKYENLICSGFYNCECTDCRNQLEMAYSCAVKDKCEPLDCEIPCKAEFKEFDLCASNFPTDFSCHACMTEFEKPLPYNSTCPSYHEEICSQAVLCECTACQHELEEAYSCRVPDFCDPLDCDLMAARECVSSKAVDCGSCIDEVYSRIKDNATTCAFFVNNMCAGFDACGCTPCQDELEKVYGRNVIDNCGPLDCSNYPIENPCTYALSLFQDCLNGTSTCVECLNNAQDAVNTGKEPRTCLDFSVGMCPAIATECECGTCRQVAEDYYSCILMNERGCTPLTCLPTNRTVVNPSPSDEMACQKEKNMVQTCYATMGSCFSCIFTTFEPLSKNASVTCSEFASEMCPAIATECDCGLCRRDLEEYYSCWLLNISDGRCEALDCKIPDPVTPTPAATDQTKDASAALHTIWLWRIWILVGAVSVSIVTISL